MKAFKTLDRPVHWQDFETLCLKLWGEIWQCPEIKKNGRSGDIQNGVDIYGKPKGESEYFGIQCKGKDSSTHKPLTRKEIDLELDKAKSFQPTLKKLYIVTTAVKNADIETYIRIKDIECCNAGFFEVHMFSWEDIVQLLYDNPKTYDWYVNSEFYNRNNKFSLKFESEATSIHKVIPFSDEDVTYKRYKAGPEFINDSIVAFLPHFDSLPKINKSLVNLELIGHNCGDKAIENIEIEVELLNQECQFVDTNLVKWRGLNIQETPNYELGKQYSIKSPRLLILAPPEAGVLVPRRRIEWKNIFIKVPPTKNKLELSLNWNLYSRTLSTSGQLKIQLTPEIIRGKRTEDTHEESKIGITERLLSYHV